jgi:hypothetical protein
MVVYLVIGAGGKGGGGIPEHERAVGQFSDGATKRRVQAVHELIALPAVGIGAMGGIVAAAAKVERIRGKK